MRPAARRPRVHCPLRSAAVAVSVFPPEKMKTNTIGARRQKLTSDINTGAKHNSKEQLKNWKNGRGGKRKKLEMKSGGRKGLAGGAQEFTGRCSQLLLSRTEPACWHFAHTLLTLCCWHFADTCLSHSCISSVAACAELQTTVCSVTAPKCN